MPSPSSTTHRYCADNLFVAFLQRKIMLKFGLFLTRGFVWLFFTCSLAVCQSLLSLPLQMHAGSQPYSGGVCGWDMQCTGGMCGLVREICGPSIPSCLWAGFLMNSMKQLTGSMSFQCPPTVLYATFPVSSYPIVMQLMVQYSGLGEREMGFFGNVLHSWWSQEFTHMLLLSLEGKIIGWEVLSFYWAVPPWQRGDTDK